MVRTTTLAAAGSLVALLSLAGAAHAATNATVVIQAGTPHYSAPPAYAVQYHAPPPPRYERVPPAAPRHGLVAGPLGMARPPPCVGARPVDAGAPRPPLPPAALGAAQ